ncbi:Lipoxygenase [Cordyceps fumosorosea ARSEF 2679]|uniref:Manganese lipoxygenase n=1 Tax=Cordyceps fumosorosea (strain ARSEF 2679) TaxID=1081104 RepID=A0A167LE49_CORFA|nr:Lipoxygenase [Cordyceps fumosorosea ARSEF 2679]OAA52979.1 Lipoxygenase [Cordyceps fumosorosea ARSEF 2679]
MRTPATTALLCVLLGGASAAPQLRDAAVCIPQRDSNPHRQAAGVSQRNSGFVYGPSLIGEAAPFPNGTMGNARSKGDYDLWSVDRKEIDSRIAADLQQIQAAVKTNGGLRTWDDYGKVLYEGQLKQSNPRGPAPGIIANATQDLASEKLPFDVNAEIVGKVVDTGATLHSLQASKRLFYVDHSYQNAYTLPSVVKRFPVACSAYFYIDPKTNDFLPLAIKTNTGIDLTYTPLDSAADWLLAKMMFNANDMFHAQMLHLVISHDVSESVHQAALHTLSENHPVIVVLERLMLQAYSSRIVGEELCFNPGGHWDQLMAYDKFSCRRFVSDQWPVAGKFRAGALETDLESRGLLDHKGASVFKSFPFWDDAKEIRDAYRAFFESFVESYYRTELDLAGDWEVRNWFAEASAHAKAQDFPPAHPLSRATLVDVLTHFGFVLSVGHHSMNGGAPIASRTRPFHIPALYAAPPAAKGVTDLLPYLPDAPTALHYIGFMASFNRPFYGADGRTLESVFSGDGMLKRLNKGTNDAAAQFLKTLQGLSDKIRARKFDGDGLSQGMPFLYRTLDPGYIPFFCAV